jgi:hypothetical protein
MSSEEFINKNLHSEIYTKDEVAELVRQLWIVVDNVTREKVKEEFEEDCAFHAANA